MKHDRIEIGKLVKLRQGFAINKNSNHHISEEITPLHLLRIGDMKDQKFSIFVKDSIPTHFIANENDIIYTRTGQVGLVFRNQKGVVHNNCFTVNTLDDSVLSQNYLYYALQEPLFYEEATSRAKGAAQPDLPHGVFCSIKLFLPPIKTQNKIASILSAFDDLIENNQKQIKLLEEAAQRLYKKWFVDLRFPGHENVKIVDGVPEGWSYEPLSEFAYIEMGQSPKSEYYNLNKDGLPFHQGVGSYGNRFVKDDVFSSRVTKIGDAGSILFSVRAPVGRINLTRNRIVIGRGLAAINHKRGKQSFLFYKLKQYFFKEDILGNGSIFASINKNQLMSLEFLMPSDDLINKFDSIVREIDKKIDCVDSQIEHLQEARDRLLPKLMSGEIEV